MTMDASVCEFIKQSVPKFVLWGTIPSMFQGFIVNYLRDCQQHELKRVNERRIQQIHDAILRQFDDSVPAFSDIVGFLNALEEEPSPPRDIFYPQSCPQKMSKRQHYRCHQQELRYYYTQKNHQYKRKNHQYKRMITTQQKRRKAVKLKSGYFLNVAIIDGLITCFIEWIVIF